MAPEVILEFTVLLAVVAALFGSWRTGWPDPRYVLAGSGVLLLFTAFLLTVNALYTACHGDYDFMRDPFGCTRPIAEHGQDKRAP